MSAFRQAVTTLSAYRKTEDHLTRKTLSGAVGESLSVPKRAPRPSSQRALLTR